MNFDEDDSAAGKGTLRPLVGQHGEERVRSQGGVVVEVLVAQCDVS